MRKIFLRLSVVSGDNSKFSSANTDSRILKKEMEIPS